MRLHGDLWKKFKTKIAFISEYIIDEIVKLGKEKHHLISLLTMAIILVIIFS